MYSQWEVNCLVTSTRLVGGEDGSINLVSLCNGYLKIICNLNGGIATALHCERDGYRVICKRINRNVDLHGDLCLMILLWLMLTQQGYCG